MLHWLWKHVTLLNKEISNDSEVNSLIKMYHEIFICGSWELNGDILICLPQVIVFLNLDIVNQLPVDSDNPKHYSLITEGKRIWCFIIFFIKWIAPQGVLHPFCSENVLLHVLNRRSSLPSPPSLLPSLWHNKLVLTSPMMRMIRTGGREVFEKWIKLASQQRLCFLTLCCLYHSDVYIH